MSRIIMSKIMPKFKPFFFALVGFFAAVGLLSFSHIGPASAQSPGVNLAQLVAQVNALQSTVSSQATTISNLKAQEQTDIKTTQNQEQKDIQNTQKQEQTDFTKLNGSVAALQTLTTPLSLSSDPNVGGTNTLLTIKGVNVQIVDGNSSGLTDDGTQGEVNNAKLSGLGNLIIGYNGPSYEFHQTRSGSHNLVLGDANNYTSFGGIVSGIQDAVTAPYATITGGYGNLANGDYASVSGGKSNTASGDYASVSGGKYNTASSDSSSVSGGKSNTASGSNSSVSGGSGNTASSDSSSVSGGSLNTASGTNTPGYSVASWVGGGDNNTATAPAASVAGGANRYQSHAYGWSGGHYATDGP